MSRYLIYVFYDSFEYVNYYNLVCDDEVIIESCPIENIENLFDVIIKETSTFELIILQEKNASSWDYKSEFLKYNIIVKGSVNTGNESLCQKLHKIFGYEYVFSDTADDFGKKIISVLFSGKCTLNNICVESDCKTEKVEGSLVCDNEEMTELARIINEKYKRMNNYE